MADNTTELEVLDQIVDVLGGQSGQYDTVVPVLQQIKELLAAGITDPEAIAEAVTAWLDEHPEATTTVQDGSITGVKIADDTIPDAKLAQTGGVLSVVNDSFGRIVPSFEMGNILYSNSSWSYSSSTTRVRTPSGSEIPLKAGSVIELTDTEHFVMYVGWKRNGTPSNYSGWMTGKYVVPEDGEYSILVRKNPETSVSVSDVQSIVYVYDANAASLVGVANAVSDKNLFDVNAATMGSINSNGSFTVNTYTASNTLLSDYIPVTAGEKLRITIGTTITSTSGYGIWAAWAFYDSSRQQVGSVTTESKNYFERYYVYTRSVTVPDGASYMRVSGRTYGDGYIRVSRNSEDTAGAAMSGAMRKLDMSVATDEPFAKLILSRNYGYIDLDTTAKTLTIPTDTVLVTGDMRGGYRLLNASNPVTISYDGITSTAVKFAYSLIDETFYAVAYDHVLNHISDVIIAVCRTSPTTSLSCACPYRVNGIPYNLVLPTTYNVKSINHRGYGTAPENTLPAYKLSKANMFEYVECDVRFTSDGVPVLLHDESINRTAMNADGTTIDSTVNIASITYEEALDYDFGVYKAEKYAGTPIPTFEQFITLCRNLGLHPYIELKAGTQAQVEGLVDTVAACGMAGKVSWISFSMTLLGYVKDYDAGARLGYVVSSVTSDVITAAQALATATNEVFIDAASPTSTEVELCVDSGIPLEVWTINSAATINALPTYVSGVTSDTIHAGDTLLKANI